MLELDRDISVEEKQIMQKLNCDIMKIVQEYKSI